MTAVKLLLVLVKNIDNHIQLRPLLHSIAIRTFFSLRILHYIDLAPFKSTDCNIQPQNSSF